MNLISGQLSDMSNAIRCVQESSREPKITGGPARRHIAACAMILYLRHCLRALHSSVTGQPGSEMEKLISNWI